MIAGLDTETTGVDFFHGSRPFMVTLSDTENTYTWEWRVDPNTREVKTLKKDIIAISKAIQSYDKIVLHNSKFDVRALESIGIELSFDNVEDTIIGSHLLGSEGPHGLKEQAIIQLGLSDEDEDDLKQICIEARRIAKRLGWDLAKKGHHHFPGINDAEWWKLDMWVPRELFKRGHDVPPEFENACRKYCHMDVYRTLGLYYIQQEEIPKRKLTHLYEERMKGVRTTYAMESNGVSISKTRIDSVVDDYSVKQEYCQDVCKRMSGNTIDNLNSPVQLRKVLFERLNLKPLKPSKKSDPANPTWSTDKETLDHLLVESRRGSLERAFLKRLVEYRALSQALGYLKSYKNYATYLGDFLYVHPNFNITGTKTTRFSCKDPNAQNIGKREQYNIRYVFGPLPKRVWYAIDYDNIELRLFAYCSGDQELIAAFEAGKSVHMVIAEVLHPKLVKDLGEEKFKKTDTYRKVKNGNFSLIYGASERRADRTYEVEGAYKRIRSRFPKIDEFMETKAQEARDTGMVVTLGGYPLEVPEDKPHSCVNYFIQGSAGLIMLKGMNAAYEYLKVLGSDHKMIMAIHDELVFDLPRSNRNEKIVKNLEKLMSKPGLDLGIPTPASADLINENWSEGVAV